MNTCTILPRFGYSLTLQSKKKKGKCKLIRQLYKNWKKLLVLSKYGLLLKYFGGKKLYVLVKIYLGSFLNT